MRLHRTTRAAALLAALAMCATSALAAMPDGEFVELCAEGTAEQVQKALKGGANPNAKDEYEQTALVRAASGDNLSMVRALLKAGANPNAKDGYDDTPLHMATFHGASQSVVQALLEAGANPNARNKSGHTALMYAVFNNSLPVVQALLKAGANPNAKNNDGHTALTGWDSITDGDVKNRWPSVQVFKAMLAAGADIDGGCDGGEECLTALVALMNNVGGGGDAASVRVLLDGGAARNRKGLDRALREAPQYGTPETVGLLLKAGANPNAQGDGGQTALMNAARFGKRRIVDVLLAAGADRNARDGEGHDALWHARNPDDWDDVPISKADKDEIIRLLQQGGGAKKPAEQGAAALRVYLSDPTGTATNVRTAPGGAVAGALAAGGDYIVTLAGCEKGWCRATAIDTVDKGPVALAKGGERWLHTSVLAFSTRNYGGQKLALRAKPDEKAAPAFSFTDERALRPLDVRAGWVLAETLDKKHRGWLQTEWVCGNPVTTCP